MKMDVLAADVSAIVRQIESGHMMPDSTRSGLMDFVSRVLPSATAAASQLTLAENEHVRAVQERRDFDPETIKHEVDSNAIFTEQIATYLLKSMREHIYVRLAAFSTAEKVRTTTSAAATLARIGMPEFVAEVGSVVDVLERVKNVDLKAHEKWYEQVALEVSQSNATA